MEKDLLSIILLNRFTTEHNFEKPNDLKGIRLMCLAGMTVMQDFNEIFMAYGQSDEFSFVFERKAEVFNRRSEKIVSCVVSRFTSAYMFYWKSIFSTVELKTPPSFDARIVLYPSYINLRDYFSWRQADCHINNLYNTCFWALVESGKYSKQQANELLKPTFSCDKNEILFKQFNINYNTLPKVFRKGTTLYRKIEKKEKKSKKKEKSKKEDNNEQLKENQNSQNVEVLVKNKEEIKEEETKKINENMNDILDNKTENILMEDTNFQEIYKKSFNNIFISNEDIIKPDFWVSNSFTENEI